MKNKIIKRYNLWYYSFHVFNFILFVILLYLAYVLLTFNIKFTFYEPPTAPGQLIENRYSNLTFWFIWVFYASCLLLLVFNTMRLFAPQREEITIPHLTITFATIVVLIITLIFFIITFNSANNSPNKSPSGAGNMCNDYRYCCVYGSLPNSKCPILTAPCAPFVNVTDLKTNFECNVTVGFLPILIVLCLLIFICGWVMGKGVDIFIEQYETDYPFSNIEIMSNVGGSISQELNNNYKTVKTT